MIDTDSPEYIELANAIAAVLDEHDGDGVTDKSAKRLDVAWSTMCDAEDRAAELRRENMEKVKRTPIFETLMPADYDDGSN